MAPPQPRWWKDGTAYQIWPASYKDLNGDGFGDLAGIISTLDYLKDLGIDIIWLSPMYDSPQHDMGYDIRNYEAVWDKFGTMADMDTLISEVHKRGLRLILDLVVNHTSDEHAWFQESKKDRTNPKADWYIWRDPKYDSEGKRQPPNNWRSIFGGSAWEYVPERDQYYLHLFVKQQPDLNWENETTRRAIYKSAIQFWLDKGIDGFRVDVVNLYSKPAGLPDAAITHPGEIYQHADAITLNGPRMHEWLQEQRREVLDKYGDVVLVGELPGTGHEETMKYLQPELRELDMVFDFDMVSMGGHMAVPPHQVRKHNLPEFKDAVWKVQKFLESPGCWATVFAENHDQGRSLSRFATDAPQFREKAAKLLAILLGTLSGTLFVYQGQEIGMTNFPSSWGEADLRDVAALNYIAELKEKHPGDGEILKRGMAGLQKVGRDSARTPVQWSAGENAGFSKAGVEPWIRVNDNFEDINVASQLGDPNSPLNFWKEMLQLRKENADVFVHGLFKVFDYENLSTFCYEKKYDDKRAVVVCNFSDEEQPFAIPPEAGYGVEDLRLLIANVGKIGEKMSPWEARAYSVDEEPLKN